MVQDLASQVAEIVKRKRTGKQWSQVKLAAESGVSLTVVQGLESETRTPTLRTITRLADALQIRFTLSDDAPRQEVPPPPLPEEEDAEEEEEYGEAERAGDEEIVRMFRKKFPDTMAPEALMFLRKQPAILESANRLGIGL